MRQGKAQLGVSRQALTRCIRCREPRHNLYIYKKNTIDTA